LAKHLLAAADLAYSVAMSITREDLEQDRLRTILDNTPIASALLSEAALEASWRAALAALPDPNGDVRLRFADLEPDGRT
jgi:cation transport protein ChaC